MNNLQPTPQPAPIVAVLDIGTTKVCAIIARKTPTNKIEILGIGKAASQGMLRGVISNIDKTVASITEAMEQASRQANIQVKNVYVGIAGQHIKCTQHKGYRMRNWEDGEITQHDLDQLINDMYKNPPPAGEMILHILPQEYTVDNEAGIKDPIGMSGVKLGADFIVVTGQISSFQNIKRCIEKAGMSIADIILEPLASCEAVLNPSEREAGVALIDIGGGTTDLAIFQDGIIRHTSVIPIGGNTITEDIKEGCVVLREQAEKLKTNFGIALAKEAPENTIVSVPGMFGRDPREISLRNLAHIIQARMEEILEYTYNEIKESGFANKLIAGIVVTGGGAHLRNLKELTEYITTLGTRIGEPTTHLANKQYTDLKNPMYATAIGLIIKALEKPISAQELQTALPLPIAAATQNPNHITRKEQLPAVQPQQLETAKNNTDTAQYNPENDSEQHEEEENKGFFERLIQKGLDWLGNDVKDFK